MLSVNTALVACHVFALIKSHLLTFTLDTARKTSITPPTVFPLGSVVDLGEGPGGPPYFGKKKYLSLYSGKN